MSQYYQQRYYAYQTIARGLLTVEQLAQSFEALSHVYWYALHRYLPRDKSAVCLDLPCGYGNFLYFLKKHGYRNCRGYDLDPRQVGLATSLGCQAAEGNVFDVLANLAVTPSLIASIDFIEHLDKSTALRFSKPATRAYPQAVPSSFARRVPMGSLEHMTSTTTSRMSGASLQTLSRVF